ncbi:hypothetical protein HYALB_00001487 [Hymenoscyphus albidus]|uniref:Subtelomeric hrmA-associated cluster protein AFUB-079030/YDR124W-like helical bundle domain-containing protein n=1 Tax=Hymenoscyphus albidus TaxID=595503 RepID=A0A9N9LDX9_9HELO|nr:hypothetical protein HYALB_00001487 [Hymenoscyphus albidus]
MVANRGGPPLSQGGFYPSRDTLTRSEDVQDRTPAFMHPPMPAYGNTSIGDALRDYAGIPVRDFVLACRLDNGEEKTYHSKSFRPYISKVFTERFRRDFTHYSHRASAERGYTGAGYGQDGTYNELEVDSTEDYRKMGSGGELARSQYRPRYSRSEDSSEEIPGCKRKRGHYSGNDVPISIPTQKTEPLVIGQSDKVEQYYVVRFKDMQQSSCKVMGKAFVKLVEPKKQTHHPYTGGNAGAPPWWPPTIGENHVRHKEPDHLLKPERIRLLVHILRMIIQPQSQQVSAVAKQGLNVKKLEEVTMEAMSNWFSDKDHPENAEKKPFLKEIFKVAREEERYKNGEIDGDTAIPVMFGDQTGGEESDVDNDAVNEEEEAGQENVIGTNNSATPELVSPPMMMPHRQFEPEQQTHGIIQHRPHPTLIRPSAPHLEDSSPYAETYGRQMSSFPQSPSLQDPYRPRYAPNVSPGYQSPQQNLYPTSWQNHGMMTSGPLTTSYCATSSPQSITPPSTLQLPALSQQVASHTQQLTSYTQGMLPPRMSSQPFEMPHTRQYDPGPGLGNQMRMGGLSNPHAQHTQNGYSEFLHDANSYSQNESEMKEGQQHLRP